MSLDKIVSGACRDLPVGVQVRIMMECDEAWVEVTCYYGVSKVFRPEPDESIQLAFDRAMDWACG